MKKLIIAVSISTFLLFVWGIWLTNRPLNPHAQKSIGRSGAVYDLDKQPDAFVISGFKYYDKSPYKKKQLKTVKLWVLSNHTVTGTMSIGGFQRARRRLKDVTVLVKYHLSSDKSAFLTVKGTDMSRSEQVQEDLPQAGDSYCTRVVFLGPVHEVELEAIVSIKAFIIVDEFKVAVGSPIFDKMEEVTCQ